MELINELLVQYRDTISLGFIIQTATAFGWLLLFLILRKVLAGRLLSLMTRLTEKTHYRWDSRLVRGLEKPLKGLFLLSGLYLFAIHFPPTSGGQEFWLKAFRSLAVLLVFSGLAGFFEAMVSRQLRETEEIEDTLIPLIRTGVKIVVFLLAALVVAEEWNYDIKGFIAGLGLAGFALAMGAQETIRNVLSGFFIISDKIFKVGDWIANDKLEGIVEELNYRTTKIRTFAQSVITVPNSVLVDGPLTNWSEMKMRQLRFTLGVTYGTTPEQMSRIVARIRELLVRHEQVTDEPARVYFTEFGDSSLDILIYVFLHALDFDGFHHARQEINLAIMEILQEEGATVAFPSRSVYMENPVRTVVRNLEEQQDM